MYSYLNDYMFKVTNIMNNPNLVMLWHHAFYDHPLDGVAMYKGIPVWFSVKDNGGWESLDTLPKNRSTLSKYELESIETKEEILKNIKMITPYDYDIIEGHWCRDTTYLIYKLTDKQFAELNNYHNKGLDYGFNNDHRPEKTSNHKPSHTPDEWFKLNLPNLSFSDYTRGEILGEFRWFEFTNWKRT